MRTRRVRRSLPFMTGAAFVCSLSSLVPSPLGAAPAVASGDPAAVAPARDRASGLAVLSGVVLGPDGIRLPGATLFIRRPDGSEVARGATGDRGVFRLPGIAPGRYELVVESPGFQPAAVAIDDLRSDEGRSVEVVLTLATRRESLTVFGLVPRGSLEASAIRESPARDVGEALGSMAGVWALRKGGIANDVVVRGLQRGDLNVLVDGQRLHGACPNRMDPAAFHVDFAEVDRVDVAKGSFDVRHQGSLGGVVNVVTRRPEPGVHLAPNLATGSFGHANPALTASWAGDGASALAGFSYRRSEPFRDGSGARFTEGANYRADAADREAYRVGTGWVQLGWRASARHRFQLGWTRQEAKGVLYPYLMMDAVYDDTDRVNLVYDASGLAGRLDSVTAQAYFARVDHWMTDELRSSGAPAPRGWSMGTLAGTETLGGRVEARLGGSSVGVEAFRHRWDAETQMAGMGYRAQASIPDVENRSVGIFAETTRGLGQGLQLTAGARLDHVRAAADEEKANTDLYHAYHGTRALSRSDTLPSATVRVVWEPGGGLELVGALGHTTRVAEGHERFFALQRRGTDWVGQPGLDPARHTGFDLTATWERGGLSLSTSAFAGRVDGHIAVVPVARRSAVAGVTNTAARTWANVDATLRGLELAAVVPLTRGLFLSGDFSLVHGAKDADAATGLADEDLAEMPPLRGRLALRYDDGRLFAVAEGVFSGDQDRVDGLLGETPTAGWGIANVTGGYRRGRLALSVGVANLFDRLYTEHLSYQRDPYRSGVRVPAPGRGVFVNLSTRF